MVAAAAMAGVPLLNGFLSKEMFFAETLGLQGRGALAVAAARRRHPGRGVRVAYSLRFIHDTFFNGEPRPAAQPHEPPFFMRLPVLLLVLLCLAGGPGAAGPDRRHADVAAQAAVHAGGAAAALPAGHVARLQPAAADERHGGGRRRRAVLRPAALSTCTASRTCPGLPRGGREALPLPAGRAAGRSQRAPRLLQNGSLQRYLALLWRWRWRRAWRPGSPGCPGGSCPPGCTGRAGIRVDGSSCPGGPGHGSAAGALVLHRQRLVAVVLMGAVGLVVCLLFVWFSAPGPGADTAAGGVVPA
jgi:multicomponent K+:H+ antiporter subunit A